MTRFYNETGALLSSHAGSIDGEVIFTKPLLEPNQTIEVPREKTVILLGMWGKVNSEEIDEEQMSYGVVTHLPGYKKVVFSGAVHPEGDIKEQTRQILAQKQRALSTHGGSYDDDTTLRMFVREELLSPETQVRINEARSEFFERPHYPAATMVGVSDLLHEDALIEIEIEAEIPDHDWETEVITEDG